MQNNSSSNRHGLTSDEAKALCDKILGFAKAGHTRVNINSGWRGFTRTATNKVTSAGGSEDVTVQISSVFGKRVATVKTNRLDDAALTKAVRDSESLARLAPENPEYMPELGAQQYTTVRGYYDTTGGLTTETRARAAALAIEAAKKSDTVAAGFMDVDASSQAVATSGGLFAYQARTGVASTLTARTADGLSSGWAGDEAADWNTIESERIAQDAVRKCQEWKNKTALEPGRYEVVLEPTAAGMLMLRLMGVFDARQADEGRSYFAKQGGNRLGEQVFDPKVTIYSDPAEPNAETNPFTSAGIPVRRQVWIQNGVLKTVSYSRFWADKKGTAPIPAMSNLVMNGGSASVDDMVRSIQRGVLITRFWYIRGLNARTISQTGLTRDGTFLIENGKISRPVTNFRFNQSLVELLQKVDMLGRPTRVCASESSSVSSPIVVPAMKVRDFFLASVSDAI